MELTRTDSAPRLAAIVDILDRFFPLAWIGLYLLLPVSGWAPVMFDGWFDQQRDLEALRSVLAEGHADAIAGNFIGPAYIAAAALVHALFGLSPEDSLVALTRASYALAAAAGLVLVRVVVGRITSAPPLVSLTSQVAFVALVFSAGTWHWSDVPWSHFFAAFLAVALYAIRYAPPRIGLVQAGAAGVVLALLALTRSFELVALVAAWGIALGGLALLRLPVGRAWRARHILTAAAGFVVTTAVVYAATGKRDLFFLYSSTLDRQSGNVPAAEIAETPTFSLGLVPVKLVQLFLEPCYEAMCSLADYAGGSSRLPPQLQGAAGNERLWRLPLAVQLPALVLLPLCVLGVIALVAWFARRRERSKRVRELRLLVEMTLASSGIVLGYAASTMTGSPHLRYGFARVFLLPALLTAIVAVCLGAIGLWPLVSRLVRRSRFSPTFCFVVISVIVAAGVVTGATYARSHGIPRIEGKQLGTVSYIARCVDRTCEVSLDARTPSGERVAIREASTLTFGCGSERARFTIYVEHLSGGVHLDRPCHDPRLVGAWPTLMGLPPGSYELAQVPVTNLSPAG